MSAIEPTPSTDDPPPPRAQPRRLRDRWRSAQAQRRAGRVMIGVGVTGALLAVIGTVTAWMFVGELHAATDETLAVTEQTLDAVDDTIDLAATVLDSTTDAVGALAGTLGAVSGSFEAGTGAIDDIAGLAETIGPSLEDAADTTRNLQSIGDDIDRALVALSSLPIGPDYDPASGLGDTFGQLADALEPIPDRLADTASSLTGFTDSTGALQTELEGFTESVQAVSDGLADSDALVDQYRDRVADARALAADTRADLADDVALMRLLIVIGGVTLLISQIVPLWMGRSLLDQAELMEADVVDAEKVTGDTR